MVRARGLAKRLGVDLAIVDKRRERAGVSERTHFEIGDIFDADIAMASVVTIYLFPEANIALRPKLLADLAPGTRLVSNSFHMGDWAPDARAQGRTSGGALLWIIPANAAGIWRFTTPRGPARLMIEQRYQQDAYHSLSIEGYQVTETLIEKIDKE